MYSDLTNVGCEYRAQPAHGVPCWLCRNSARNDDRGSRSSREIGNEVYIYGNPGEGVSYDHCLRLDATTTIPDTQGRADV